MNWLEYNFTIDPVDPGSDILIAHLADAGFNTFEQTTSGLLAYILKDEFREVAFAEAIDQMKNFKLSFSVAEIPQINWNEEWEKNFSPVSVRNVLIRAPFHPAPSPDIIDLLIIPKMSFGTGHHNTTALMVEAMLDLDFKEKQVLDIGSGTGILAILASVLGATHVDAIDIDEWAYENALENIQLNSRNNISVFKGDASLLENRSYNIILANINRNIITKDISLYFNSLNPGGILLCSGFLIHDDLVIQEAAASLGLKMILQLNQNSWSLLGFKKDI